MMTHTQKFDAVVVGGGPSGATAAADLARNGRSVLMLDRGGRIKPCGGAIPPVCVTEFGIPDSLIVARATGARIVAPSDKEADMPIDGEGYVGMVDREHFDEWLRERAASLGAVRQTGSFDHITHDPDGTTVVHYTGPDGAAEVRTRTVIGADGAKSKVAKQCVKGWEHVKYVFAYHEIVRSPAAADFDQSRCDVYYQGTFSPDFYAWVFPHGDTMSIGTGSAQKGFGLRPAIGALRKAAGLDGLETIRREGAPIPLRPMKRWDNGRDVVLAGDAAGVVAPASGEGIYYAMLGGRLAAGAVEALCATGDVRSLRLARKRFMKAHGKVFLILGIMQWFWYSSDSRREKFVKMCRDPDVQRMTWEGYMHKKLVMKDPIAHIKIFLKDTAQLLGLARA
ncbi:MAG: geranylgeranyl diphosphate reductase [Gemmatimonadaceae bacterium]|nr:geranylgeranyl diphosphate reductase [Acetobacteraceae bacterium]